MKTSITILILIILSACSKSNDNLTEPYANSPFVRPSSWCAVDSGFESVTSGNLYVVKFFASGKAKVSTYILKQNGISHFLSGASAVIWSFADSTLSIEPSSWIETMTVSKLKFDGDNRFFSETRPGVVFSTPCPYYIDSSDQ